MGRQLILGIAALVFALPAWSGEIIGNTYIGEKHGYIEIQSPGGKWRIEDQEGQGINIAKLTLKDAISGDRPNILFMGFPKMVGMTVDLVLGSLRNASQQQGIELGPIEPKRYGGKLVHTYTGTMTKGAAKVMQQVYIMEGDKSFFALSAAANAVAYESAKPLFDEVIENVKY